MSIKINESKIIFQSVLTTGCVLVLLLLGDSVVYSQTASTCILKGTVKEWVGAVVPNAIVTVSNSVFIRKATSNEFGEYSITLPSGIYKVVVEGPLGLDTTYRSDIKLNPNSTRWLNLRVYFKFLTLEQPEKYTGHPLMNEISYSYEELPDFSETGVFHGVIRFVEKCQSKVLLTYNGRAINDPKTLDARATFSYDFFSVIADEFRMKPNTKVIYALGNMEIEKDNDYLKYSGVIKISIKNGNVIYEKIK